MKRSLIWLPTALITFLVGVSFAVWWVVREGTPMPVETVAVRTAEPKLNCVIPSSFPGLSVDLLEGGLQKNGDPFRNEWYRKHLKAMGEASLAKSIDDNGEVYRFLWLRSFHRPIMIRVERQGRAYGIYSRELNGAGGYEPGKVLRTDRREIFLEEWCELIRLVDEAKYWQMPRIDLEDGGLDGAQWILESVKENRYHVVDRWSPEDGDYRRVGVYLLKLAGYDTTKLGSDLY